MEQLVKDTVSEFWANEVLLSFSQHELRKPLFPPQIQCHLKDDVFSKSQHVAVYCSRGIARVT